jgi:hypothetical protein
MLYQKIVYSCQLLGVTTQANLSTIKKAYWNKAKLYHPDVNASSDAQATFIQLTNAYDFLHDMLSSNATLESYKQQYANTTAESYVDTDALEKQRMAEARTRYEAFIKSDEYKTEIAFQNVVQFFKCLVLGVFILACIIYNIVLLVQNNPMAWLCVIGAVFFGMLFILNYPSLKIKTIVADLKTTFQDKQIVLVVFLFTTFFIQILFTSTIWMASLINMGLWFIIVFIITITCFYFFGISKGAVKLKRLLFSLIIVPNLVNIFLVLNYAFSYGSYKEGYYRSYINELKPVNINGVTVTHWPVFFKKYNHYFSISTSKTDKIPLPYNFVIYTFKKGLFGIDVISSVDYL